MRIRFIVVAALLALLSAPLFAQQTAVIKSFVGLVQLKVPGGEWVNAAPGALLTQGTFVSTGFNSSAVLDLGTSQIQVKQLTRMRLDELLRNAGNITTKLFLTVGTVQANVDNSAGLIQNFTLTSPVSTAAVRGTIFEFDGYVTRVDRGIVLVVTPAGLSREVREGQETTVSGLYLPSSPEDSNQSETNVSSSTTGQGGGATGGGATATTGSIVVTVN